MKVLLVLFSLLFSNINFNESLNIKTQYEEVEYIEYSYGDYALKQNNEIIEVFYNNQRINVINNIQYFKAVYHDSLLSLFYKPVNNDYITLIKYKSDKISLTKKIDNPLIGEFDVVFWNNNYLLATSINEYQNNVIKNNILSKDYLLNKNGILLIIDTNGKIINCEIYGGELDDYFQKIYLDEYTEQIYITGKKSQNSGYDFGNGGYNGIGYLLLNIDYELKIINYAIFDLPINNLIYNDSGIEVFTQNEIISLDYNYNMLSSLKIDDYCILGMKMNKYYYAILTRRELKIYDYNKNKLLYNGLYNFNMEVNDVKCTKNYIYFINNNQIIKSIFYNDIYSNYIFSYDDFELNNINKELDGLPKRFTLQDIFYDDPYDPLVYGKYDLILDYGEFIIKSQIEVQKRCNVTNGYLYPTGYKLEFSGKGYLNGTEIYNNHQITTPGNYQLVLEGFNDKDIIDFVIDDMDIKFIEEDNKNWNIEIRKNQEFIIELYCNNLKDIKIEDVIMNNESADFTINESLEKIELKLFNENIGTYNYKIEKIIYNINNQMNELNINHNIVVRVIEDKISLEKNYYNNNKNFVFNTILYDEKNMARFIKIDCEGNISYISLKNDNIISLNDECKNKIVNLYLVYDVKGGLYEEVELFALELNDYNKDQIGIINLLFDNDDLKEITFNMEMNKNIKSILVNGEKVYNYQNVSNYNYIFYSIGFIIILFVSYKLIKVIKHSNKESIN